MLQVTKLTKKYKEKTILQQISFTVATGEVIGLVGENGAGKSTLLNILATVIPPTDGQILLHNTTYTNVTAIRQQIGYVPQELSIWEELSVADNMRFFSALSWKKISLEQCRQICQKMQLTQWEEKVANLSGGMKRKLNLAISLIHDPQLILLDEPTVGIDMRSKEEIGHYLVRLAKQQGKIIIYTSHDMNEIEQFCDRVYTIGEDPFYEKLLQARGVRTEKLLATD